MPPSRDHCVGLFAADAFSFTETDLVIEEGFESDFGIGRDTKGYAGYVIDLSDWQIFVVCIESYPKSPQDEYLAVCIDRDLIGWIGLIWRGRIEAASRFG